VVVGDTAANRPVGYERRAAVWVHLPEAADPLGTALELVFHLSHNHSLDEAVERTASGSDHEILADPGYLDRTRLTDVLDLAVGLEDLLRVEEAMTSAEPPPPAEPTAPPPSAPPPTGPPPPLPSAPPPPTPGAEPPPRPRRRRRSLRPDLPSGDREPGPPPPAPSLGDDFRSRPFEHETHDAADAADRLDDLRRRTTDREHRFLAASSELLALDGGRIRARLEIDILPLRLQTEDEVIAPERFPDERLDWRGGDVSLDIVLFELRDGGQALRDRVELPAVGRLRAPARFEVVWPGGPFEARVAVLYRQRFVQTMLLTVFDDGRPPAFETECVVRPASGDLRDLEPHQASIILNDRGGPRAMVSTEVGQVVNAPGDIASARDGIKTQMLKIFDEPEAYGSVDGEAFRALLTQLVLQGVKIRENLFTGEATAAVADRAVYESLRSADHLSVLSATVTEILPLEYVYDPEFVPPLAGPAPICPTALAAIRRSTPGHDLAADPGPTLAELRDDCGHLTEGASCGADPTMICPLGFWGFRKVIERHTNRVGHHLDAGFAVSTSPTATRPSIDISSVLAAATPKADANPTADWTAARTALGQRLNDRFKLVDGWQPIAADLVDETTHRGLLLLLPHVDKDDDQNLVLDLGTAPQLALDRVDALSLRRDSPLVLLLGCSTGEGSSPSEEFPARFLNAGAAIVLATMTLVRGRFMAPLAERLITLLLERAAADDQPLFGEALLDLRQQLLGTNPMVLTLIGYGDADWILTSSIRPDGG
jgi:hypothetical protein